MIKTSEAFSSKYLKEITPNTLSSPSHLLALELSSSIEEGQM